MKSPLRSIYLPPFFNLGRKFPAPLGEAYADEPQDTPKTMLRLGLAFVALLLCAVAWAEIFSRESRDSNTAPATKAVVP